MWSLSNHVTHIHVVMQNTNKAFSIEPIESTQEISLGFRLLKDLWDVACLTHIIWPYKVKSVLCADTQTLLNMRPIVLTFSPRAFQTKTFCCFPLFNLSSKSSAVVSTCCVHSRTTDAIVLNFWRRFPKPLIQFFPCTNKLCINNCYLCTFFSVEGSKLTKI